MMPEDFGRRLLIGAALAHLLAPARLPAAASPFGWEPAAPPPAAGLWFEDERGQSLSPAAFLGRPMLLNIWASWCAPCVIELPALDRLQRDMGNRLAVVPVSVDRTGMAAARPVLRRLKLRHLKAYADKEGEIVSRLKIPGLPASIAISSAGSFLAVRRGRVDWDDKTEREQLRSMFRL